MEFNVSRLAELPFIEAWRILNDGADTAASPGFDPAV